MYHNMNNCIELLQFTEGRVSMRIETIFIRNELKLNNVYIFIIIILQNPLKNEKNESFFTKLPIRSTIWLFFQ